MRRVGLFGGTFDPPHLAHLALAEWARESLKLDRVIFMPAGQPPHKRRRSLSDVDARIAMARLAVRGNAAFVVSTWEARREGPSFTVDTLRHLRTRHPGARLFLLIGEDSLGDLRSWHEPDEILRLATVVVAGRPGAKARRPQAGAKIVCLGNPEFQISSSLIRARARRRLSLRYLVPDAVAGYISRHGVYRRSR